MTECYQPPDGFVDQYYMYAWDPPNGLTAGQDYLNQSVLMLGGYDFVLRRVVGLDTVLQPAPSGKYMLRTMGASNMAAKPLSVGGSAELQVIPEEFYSAISQIAFDLYSASSAGGSASLTQSWCGPSSSIKYTAVTPGSAGAAITVRITNGGVSNPPIISVVGTDITIQVPADGSSVISFSSLQDIANALNGDPAASALITTTTTGAASTCFPVLGELFPAFPLQLSNVGQLAFGGVRRRRGTAPTPSYKYKLLPFQMQTSILVDWTGSGSPRSFYVPIQNYDFELWGIQISDTAGYGTSSAKLQIFDAAHNGLSNIPVLAAFLSDSVPWGRPSADRYNIGATVPPLLYPNQTNFQVDVYSLQPDPVVVNQTLTITLNGAQRIPC